MTAGQLAQDVQVSAFPERYDQRRGQALSLIATYCCGMRVAALILALALAARGLRRPRDEQPRPAAAPAARRATAGPTEPGTRRARAARGAAAQAAVRRGRAARSRPARSAWSASRARSACSPRSLEVSADGTLEDLRWERWDDRRRRGQRARCSCATATRPAPPAAGRATRPRSGSRAPRLCGARDLLRPRRRRARRGRRAPPGRPTCGRRADRPGSHRRARRRAGGAAAGRGARRAGTASGRSARGTSGTSRGPAASASSAPSRCTSTG